MGKKLTSLNRYISVITLFDKKWCIIFKHTINRLFLVLFVYPNLNTSFLALAIFFSNFLILMFIFLFRLSALNALYSKFERLKILGRTSVVLNFGVSGWGDPSQSGSPKF